ncbi:AMP-binding protein [Serinibacter salmoneus]|uniref:Acetyl-CoA synthetase n=1 Tax=Serinibacter salmoneus TaxID=556530 RepID=A0A2A9D2H9_9MICO|nr:AMP-binding protein [Serinibacter salmoneus]PFG20874.1 acetyl-CoA synthetase [Serinibacter salmoneus]
MAQNLPETALVSGIRSQAGETFRAARDLLLAHREDYAEATKRFTWPDLEHFNYALDHLDAVATAPETADRTALWLVDPDGVDHRWSYGDLREQSNALANRLRAAGIRRGSRVLLALGNQHELWLSLIALMKLGAVAVPTTTLADATELGQRIAVAHCEAVIARPEEAARYQEWTHLVRLTPGGAPGWLDLTEPGHAPTFTADAPTRASDPLFLYYTSGTTARAKLVEHTHASYTIGHLTTMAWTGVRPGDVHLNISSPGWGKHAWSSFFAPFHAEATVFMVAYQRFDPRALMHQMQRCGVSSFCAPPTVWRMLIQADLTELTTPPTSVVGAGEPLNPEVIARVQDAWGVTIRDGYGQTETTLQVGNFPGQPVKPGSMGLPAPGYAIALVDGETGKPVTEPGAPGEICLDLAHRPLGLTPGYADDAERTQEVMREGYYRTGDIAYADEDGYLFYVGRADDVFKASDYRISPFDLESAMLEHPLVRECAVIPSPDPMRLAVPKAFVTLVDGAAATEAMARELFAHSRAVLSPYKRVRRIEFAPALPKTISEKIRRVELRRADAQRYAELAEGEVPTGEFRG